MMCKYRVTHNILLKFTISRITKKLPSLLYIVQTMQLSQERNPDLQIPDTTDLTTTTSHGRITLRSYLSECSTNSHKVSSQQPLFPLCSQLANPLSFSSSTFQIFFLSCSSLMSNFSFQSHQQFNPKWSSASFNSSYLTLAYHTFHSDFVMFCSSCKCLSFCYEWLLSMVIFLHSIGDDGSSLSVDIGLKKFQQMQRSLCFYKDRSITNFAKQL